MTEMSERLRWNLLMLAAPDRTGRVSVDPLYAAHIMSVETVV